MASKTTMIPMAGGGICHKIVAALITLTILAMVINDPTGSAHTVAGIAHWFGEVIDALSTFGQALSEQP